VFAVDASPWPRCDAEASPERGYCIPIFWSSRRRGAFAVGLAVSEHRPEDVHPLARQRDDGLVVGLALSSLVDVEVLAGLVAGDTAERRPELRSFERDSWVAPVRPNLKLL
jgi:hypothetical protein